MIPLTVSNVRWFTEYRPVCVVENQWKTTLGAKDDFQYKDLLQRNAQTLYKQAQKVPCINIQGQGENKDISFNNCSHLIT